ncbi:MAG: hypothetical protein SFV55_13495 [Haliscomenobacter sp.]|uniref:hypothetical protein n=1 Tax=Haliscomenobacter sp. TaxID=2717303 RepID=UPI0029A0BB3B|nr:hypothetical protein [Haliscomenobacter sp.]MDX2069435.1 hypothetical protein [Haliscomenobacter sp.]
MDLSVGGHPKKELMTLVVGFVVGFLPQPSGRGKKKEAALPQHYLSPNQIKPNYIFRKTSSSSKKTSKVIVKSTITNFSITLCSF